jgi:predicted MPP superfamily phosphohydrolase
MIPGLEASGIRILMNDAAPIERDNGVIWIVGLDDVHFYGAHDLYKPLSGIPDSQVKILLVHSPEIIPDAADAGIAYYLCGHTHGGQICLPGKRPIWFNASCSQKYAAGPWRYQNMQGYTSQGTGSSSLAVRFHCPPEVTIHTLVRRA